MRFLTAPSLALALLSSCASTGRLPSSFGECPLPNKPMRVCDANGHFFFLSCSMNTGKPVLGFYDEVGYEPEFLLYPVDDGRWQSKNKDFTLERVANEGDNQMAFDWHTSRQDEIPSNHIRTNRDPKMESVTCDYGKGGMGYCAHCGGD